MVPVIQDLELRTEYPSLFMKTLRVPQRFAAAVGTLLEFEVENQFNIAELIHSEQITRALLQLITSSDDQLTPFDQPSIRRKLLRPDASPAIPALTIPEESPPLTPLMVSQFFLQIVELRYEIGRAHV